MTKVDQAYEERWKSPIYRKHKKKKHLFPEQNLCFRHIWVWTKICQQKQDKNLFPESNTIFMSTFGLITSKETRESVSGT